MIKGKRSKRPRPDSPPAPAASSSTAGDYGAGAASDVASGSCEFREYGEDEDMANCLILLAKGDKSPSPPPPPPPPSSAGRVYQCKTCSKSFPSFQALGGHRASHTKPLVDKHEHSLPSFAESTILTLQIPGGNLGINPPAGNKGRVHECSICGAEFASGQALGGHMRRHRPISGCGGDGEGKRARNLLALDLNLPAPEDHDQIRESTFPFAGKQQVIVFSASPMVDCHY